MKIHLIAYNIRSTHNIGSIFRTADGFGVDHIHICGYTPYPRLPSDTRLPHIVDSLTKQIHKTALGAENVVPFSYSNQAPIAELKSKGFKILALEQTDISIPIHKFSIDEDVAIVLGEERYGIPAEIIRMCDISTEIPMRGTKESFNVSVATGIILYHLRFQ